MLSFAFITEMEKLLFKMNNGLYFYYVYKPSISSHCITCCFQITESGKGERKVCYHHQVCTLAQFYSHPPDIFARI